MSTEAFASIPMFVFGNRTQAKSSVLEFAADLKKDLDLASRSRLQDDSRILAS
ncbi:MAG: hypothetical protein AAGF25_11485 [Pseudomonadota bacterium]